MPIFCGNISTEARSFPCMKAVILVPNERILKMSMELCRIIEVLHEEKPPIIHRDVKPENFIWNKKEEKLYLIDCDSARYYKEGQERDTFFLGTPEHAAPEAYGYAQ